MTELVSIDHIGQQLETIFLHVIVSVNIMTRSVNCALGFILTEMRAMLYDIVLQNMNI